MTSTDVAVRVAQLSDTHFLEADAEPEGGFGYDTTEAFEAVSDHLRQNDAVDMVVVTGDVADHGRPTQYQHAADAFASLDAPVTVCPGNHDQDAAFLIGMGRTAVRTSRVVEAAGWCFLFVDSNAGAMVHDPSGRLVDPPRYEDRLHRNGSLGQREASWVREMCATTRAEHVFIWLHHPPAAPVGLTADAAYEAEWRELLADLPLVRGFGGGHTHVPQHYTLEGRSMFVCPALKNNFDLEAKTLLPPGYRTYSFGGDGSIASELHLIDDVRWPRNPMGRAVTALLTGELSQAQFDEIVERKRAERASASST